MPADIEVESIEFEWAPPPEEHFRGGSAFDAFVVYRGGGRRGFVAIETKYAEDLAGQAPQRIRDVYVDYTREKGWWRDGAEHRLMAPATRQFWLNVLLAQSLVDRGNGFDEGCSLVLTCHDDRSALDATVAVASELIDDSTAAAAISPQWSSFEDVLAASDEVRDLDAWRSAFRRRYLDFTPVRHKLGPGDPRGQVPSEHGLEALSNLAATTSLAWAVAERVVGQDSILARGGADAMPPESLVDVLVATRRLDEAIESLKGARVRGSRGLAVSDTD